MGRRGSLREEENEEEDDQGTEVYGAVTACLCRFWGGLGLGGRFLGAGADLEKGQRGTHFVQCAGESELLATSCLKWL
jgi:hypothetical protein